MNKKEQAKFERKITRWIKEFGKSCEQMEKLGNAINRICNILEYDQDIKRMQEELK